MAEGSDVPATPAAPQYPVTGEKTAEGGSVACSTDYAARGSWVTITPSPKPGYRVGSVTVTTANGDPVEVKDNGDGTYRFLMPAGGVNVSVNFVREDESAEETQSRFFVDVPAGTWYTDAVAWAVENGITNGTDETHFSPDLPCTRAQMVTFLWRAAGTPEPVGGEMPFTDVEKGSYYEKAVLWAVEQGITKGVSETEFAPDDTVTRAQTVTFLYRFAGAHVEAKAIFADVPADAWYGEAVAWAYANGITTGTGDTTFSPEDPCVRAQIVTFLYCYREGK